VEIDPAAFESAAEYYDERHMRGWMDSWPDEKKSRVVALISEIGLPPGARVLEYGCGVGVFAEAVKRALPWLEVHGCDISETGIRKARARCPDIPFHLLNDRLVDPMGGSFDLIYSHHVLEHVIDLDTTLASIANCVKLGGCILHIIPCGNLGSLEQRISARIDPDRDRAGRFSFDDSSHLRRLSSDELISASLRQGLHFHRAWYANQFWGGVEYLTAQYHWTLLTWLNPLRGFRASGMLGLLGFALWILPLALLRTIPGYVMSHATTAQDPLKRAVFLTLSPLAAFVYPLSWVIDRSLRLAAHWEWRRHRSHPIGSEMYALFLR
jgi:SAM-dependent methyltransferase